jgi:hypothetical protein
MRLNIPVPNSELVGMDETLLAVKTRIALLESTVQALAERQERANLQAGLSFLLLLGAIAVLGWLIGERL